jgi:hypothetical protein
LLKTKYQVWILQEKSTELMKNLLKEKGNEVEKENSKRNKRNIFSCKIKKKMNS